MIGIEDQDLISKVWGSEKIFRNKDHVVKYMTVKPGTKSSLHFHQIKNETFILQKGKLIIEYYIDGEKHTTELLEPLDQIFLPACTPHCFYVPKEQEESTVFIECSVIDKADDNYRLTKSSK